MNEKLLKLREGERLNRYLHVVFGTKNFGFQWTDFETSYTDGKDIYVKHDIKPLDPALPEFTEVQKRILRRGHAIHERGHIEYDTLKDYVDWQQELSSSDVNEWEANEKYPHAWLQFFGNMLLDGREENFTATDYPETKDFLDFSNYHWRFGIRKAVDNLNDFRQLYSSRLLGMTDIDEWSPEAFVLVDSVQDLINQARVAPSTKDALELGTQIIRKVWPTLIEWMELSDQSPADFDYQDNHERSTWGDPKKVEQNVQRVLVKIGIGEAASDDEKANDEADGEGGTEPAQQDFTKIIIQEEKKLSEDQAEVENDPYQRQLAGVKIISTSGTAISEEIVIEPYDYQDLGRYRRVYQQIRRHIQPTAQALYELLQPQMDEKRKAVRTGKLMVNRIHRASIMGDPNVFLKKKHGEPGKNARAFILNDISGSTYSRYQDMDHRIIDEMLMAQVLLCEACEKANLPVASYGFTEDDDYRTIIYPFKPYGRFSNTEKGFLGAMEPRGGNRDTLALQWAVNELRKYPEEIRFLILITDGEPCFARGEDPSTMRNIVLEAVNNGIEVLAFYIGPKESYVIDRIKYMYPGRNVIVSHQLSKALNTHIKRIIRS